METTAQTLYSSQKTINLPRHIYLEDMGCALLEITGHVKPLPPSHTPLFLCSDFIQESSVNNNTLPIIRRLQFEENKQGIGVINKNFEKLVWYPCTSKYLSEIKLFISDVHGAIPTFESCQLDCTLLFIDRVSRL